MKTPSIFTLSLLISSLLMTSCKKELSNCEKQNENGFYISGPSEIYEREDLHLKIENLFDLGSGSNYYWMLPDMTLYASTISGYGVEVGYETERDVLAMRMEDAGDYTFSSTEKNCGEFRNTKFVKVLPLPCPCFDSIIGEQFIVQDSSSGIAKVLNVNNTTGSSNQFISYAYDGGQEYSIRLEFDKTLEQSRSFSLKNMYKQIEGDMTDEYRIASICYRPPGTNLSDYFIQPNVEDVYVKIENNLITFTICGLTFRRENGPTKYLSAKFTYPL